MIGTLEARQLPGSERERSTGTAAPLSKSHNRRKNQCTFTYRENSNFLSVARAFDRAQVGGGKRSAINGFSRNSRRRLMYKIAGIRRDAKLPCFMTLTYPAEFPTVARAKRDLKIFVQRFKYKYPNSSGIWKLEPQERGAPHFHGLDWGVGEAELLDWVAYTWYEIAGNGDRNHLLFHLGLLHDTEPCVAQVRSWRGVWAYASKYLGKTFEVAGWTAQWTGRFWGTWGALPEGQLHEGIISDRIALTSMRLQRKFAKMKKFSHVRVTTFCDADQWVAKLITPNLN